MSNLSLYIGRHDAIRSFCTSSKELYPSRTWLSVQHLLATAWARHEMNASWSWEQVRTEVQQRWDDPRHDGFCIDALVPA